MKFSIILISTLFVSSSFAQTIFGSAIYGNGDATGYSIAISDDRTIVAIGAPYNANNGQGSGQVKIYKWSGSDWIQLGQSIDGEFPSDYFGRSVALSGDGNIIAAGAPGNDGNGQESGHVRVYKWSGTAWIQLGGDLDGEYNGDISGMAISMSTDGGILAIGARENGSSAGHVRVYKWIVNNWVQLGGDLDGENIGDKSGWSVSISDDGSILAIGAINNDGNKANSGHVRVYKWTGSRWIRLGADIDGEANGDASGWSVALSGSGSILAIGAPRDDNKNGAMAGKVKTYKWSDTIWVPMGDDILGDSTSAGNGESLSISSEGDILVIGSPSRYKNGKRLGLVRIYNWNGIRWVQLRPDILGEAADDNTGLSLSISGDGRGLAVGTPGKQPKSYAKIYSLPSLLNNESIVYPNHIKIYPNPANRELILETNIDMIGINYSIYNMVGTNVKMGKTTSTMSTLDLEDLPCGSYIIRMNNQNSLPMKFIKI